MSDDLLFFNGMNGDTGEYGVPPMTSEELLPFIRGEASPTNLSELRLRRNQKTERVLGVKEGVDPKNLREAGWGVIFAHDADPKVKEALSDLIELRREQAGDHFRLYEGPNGYRRGKDSKASFLGRQRMGPGPADPDKVPYYLMIVGSPEAISYDFQYQLDVQYAVGRIHFDTLQEYANYAASVVAADPERGRVKLPRRVAFFSVVNRGDAATAASTRLLTEPLYDKFRGFGQGWEATPVLRGDALKARLAHLLGGDETPALLVTASHGMEFLPGSERQLPHQGALLCGDWPGPDEWPRNTAIGPEYYFSGDDVADATSLLGLLAFFFACYGAGTPLNDEFSKQAFKQRKAIAPYPFVANLPVKMLGHRHGGALAVIGHVERAWSLSYSWPGAACPACGTQAGGAQTAVFESTLQRLLEGHPVGSAVEFFNERYAELASDLSSELEAIEFGRKPDPYSLASMWTANNDARGYAVIGDPAVRLPTAAETEPPADRPVIIVPAFPGVPADQRPTPVVSDAGAPGGPAGAGTSKPGPAQAGLLTVTIATLVEDPNTPGVAAFEVRTRISPAGDVMESSRRFGKEIVPAAVRPEDEPYLQIHREAVKAALAARWAHLSPLSRQPGQEQAADG
jgi:hypothetical protein